MASEKERRFVGPRRGQIYFSVVFFLVGLLLLSQITRQTRWVENTQLFAQPRFWPAAGLIGIVLLGGLYLYKLPWRNITVQDRIEIRIWVSTLEYVCWFLGYVVVVPVIGYLPATLIFAPLLSWRIGYRSKKMLWISAMFGFATVLLFKTMLSVQIPGGLLYEYFPTMLRSIFIQYF